MRTEENITPNEDNPETLQSSLDFFAKQQEKLDQKLFELSTKLNNTEDTQKVIEYFQNEIYVNDFRHSYSSFLFIVTEIHEGKNGYQEWIFKENLEEIKRTVFLLQAPSTYSPILKLCDHISLELRRIEYNGIMLERIENAQANVEKYKELFLETSEKIKEVQATLDTTEQELKKSETLQKEAKEKMSKLQGETISVISIFAAVTLAFSGGISYLGSAISAIHNSPILKLLLTILICGFVLFNSVFILLYVVAKMIDKRVFMTCNSQDCLDCKEQKKKPCSGLKKLKKCFPYLFWIDVILLGMIIGISLFMIFQKSPICPEWLK